MLSPAIRTAEVAISGTVAGRLASISKKALISPARRLFSARRFASAATGSGSRTTLEGSPGGRPIRFALSAMKPSDFLLQNWQGRWVPAREKFGDRLAVRYPRAPLDTRGLILPQALPPASLLSRPGWGDPRAIGFHR